MQDKAQHLEILTSKYGKICAVFNAFVISGLAISAVTATKVIHVGVNFPFSTIVFSMLSYPMVDCVCELFGRKSAMMAVWLGLLSQLLIVSAIQISILLPSASYWSLQAAYQKVLASSYHVVIASILAFCLSNLADVYIYQRVKIASRGKLLWIRNIVSTFFGQLIDSSIFIYIVFWHSTHKLNLLWGTMSVKMLISVAMLPVVYGIVFFVNYCLNGNTLAFKATDRT